MSYSVPPGGLPAADRADHRPGTLHRGVRRAAARHDERHRRQPYLPHWERPALWVLARPLTGFAETFSQYVVEVAPGGGATAPSPTREAEAVLFVVGGALALTVDGMRHELRPAATPSCRRGTDWTLRNRRGRPATFHWIRKAYERVDGVDVPDGVRDPREDVDAVPMPDTDGAWTTQRFVDPTTSATTCTSTS